MVGAGQLEGPLIIVPLVLMAFRMPYLVSDSFSLEKTIRQEAEGLPGV